MFTKGVIIVLSYAITLVSTGPNSLGRTMNSLSTPDLIKKYGYPAETHSVTTEDGYILELQRIPYSLKSPKGTKKIPVLLVHGLASSSADWVNMGAEKGFGFILADLGYDVWLGNSRGNTYSKKHVTFDPNQTHGPFWNFSWHEMGMYDLPAAIDYILALTGQQKLFYVGHSQGTTQFFVMASERPEYNDKIRAMFCFAPVAYISHIPSPLIYFETKNEVDKLEELIGTRAFLQHSSSFAAVSEVGCRDGAPTQFLCEQIMYLLFGFDHEQMNVTVLPEVFGHTPAGSSTKQFFHYAQEIVSGKFRKYDYGQLGNLDRYGEETPPDYDLGKVTAPVSLNYGRNDLLVSPVDVDRLSEELGNPIDKFLVPHPKFNHADFLLAIDVKTLLFNRVTALMAKY